MASAQALYINNTLGQLVLRHADWFAEAANPLDEAFALFSVSLLLEIGRAHV